MIQKGRTFKVFFTRAFLKWLPQRQWLHLSGVYTAKKTVDAAAGNCHLKR
jgi:hypothetical protein